MQPIMCSCSTQTHQNTHNTHTYCTHIHILVRTSTPTLTHSPYWHLHGWSHNQASTGTCCTWRFPGGLLSPFSSLGGPSSGISALSPHTFHSSSEAEHTQTHSTYITDKCPSKKHHHPSRLTLKYETDRLHPFVPHFDVHSTLKNIPLHSTVTSHLSIFSSCYPSDSV